MGAGPSSADSPGKPISDQGDRWRGWHLATAARQQGHTDLRSQPCNGRRVMDPARVHAAARGGGDKGSVVSTTVGRSLHRLHKGRAMASRAKPCSEASAGSTHDGPRVPEGTSARVRSATLASARYRDARTHRLASHPTCGLRTWLGASVRDGVRNGQGLEAWSECDLRWRQVVRAGGSVGSRAGVDNSHLSPQVPRA